MDILTHIYLKNKQIRILKIMSITFFILWIVTLILYITK